MSDYPECLLVRGDAARIALPDQSVDLVFGSPPYVDARLYLEDGVDLGISRGCAEWVDWMLAVTAECLRVSRGAVVWVAAGVTRGRNYWPACEGLMWEWWKRGGHAYRPCYWHRQGIPGSGGDQWFRADVEYAMAFKRPGPLPWADSTAMGTPPVYGPGGAMANRLSDGTRVNDPWRKQGRGNGLGGRRANGKKNLGTTADTRLMVRLQRGNEKGSAASVPAIANPGTLISTGAGGGNNLGSAIAHESEAPFPEALAEHFVRSLCPPGGRVLDPFGGSGTTASVCSKHGRTGVSMDLRQSQCDLARRRIADGLRPRSKLDPAPVRAAVGQLSFLAGDLP